MREINIKWKKKKINVDSSDNKLCFIVHLIGIVHFFFVYMVVNIDSNLSDLVTAVWSEKMAKKQMVC